MTHTSKLVVDSWAWLELFDASEKGRTVESRVSSAPEVFTTVLSLAEVVSVVARRMRPYEKAVDAIRSNSRILVPTAEDAIEAGRLHAQYKSGRANLSMADAFVLQAAVKMEAMVLTGDPDFRGIKEAVLIE